MEHTELWLVGAMIVAGLIAFIRKGGLTWQARPDAVEPAFREAARRPGARVRAGRG